MPTRSDLGRLSEGQTLYPVDLSTVEAAALNTSQLRSLTSWVAEPRRSTGSGQ